MDNLQSPKNTTVQEYVVRVPKNAKKEYKVMRFNQPSNTMEFTKWTQTKMSRENNMKDFKGMDEEMPKFGAGSEFGRDQREEARRKKYGIQLRRYKVEDQPWLLKIGGKTGKRYRGVREGGVSENAHYYVFTQAPDGAFEAFPVHEWYNFTQVQKYKALSAEEAEEEFGRRNKILNYFTLMNKKRKNDEDEDDEEGGPGAGAKAKGKKGKGKKSELKISDMDDWINSDEDDSDSDQESGEEKDDDGGKKPKGGKKADQKKKKKKKKGSDDEAVEESDDGDEEGREVDYMSDSSSGSEDQEEKAKDEMKGVAEEDALKKLLNSDEEDEDEEEKEEDKDDDEAKKEETQEGKMPILDEPPTQEKPDKKDSKKKKKKKSKDKESSKGKKKSGSSDSSDEDRKPVLSAAAVPPKVDSSSSSSSRAATPTRLGDATDGKRKMAVQETPGSSKRPKMDGASEAGISEEAVRRYLIRKPMTTIELLQKFKSKKTGLSSESMVTLIAQILKKVNPLKQTIKGKMYLSLKP